MIQTIYHFYLNRQTEAIFKENISLEQIFKIVLRLHYSKTELNKISETKYRTLIISVDKERKMQQIASNRSQEILVLQPKKECRDIGKLSKQNRNVRRSLKKIKQDVKMKGRRKKKKFMHANKFSIPRVYAEKIKERRRRNLIISRNISSIDIRRRILKEIKQNNQWILPIQTV